MKTFFEATGWGLGFLCAAHAWADMLGLLPEGYTLHGLLLP